MFDCRIGKSKIKRLVRERQRAARSLYIAETTRLFGAFNVENSHSIAAANERPHVIGATYIQDRLTLFVFFDKVLEAPLAEEFPQRHLEGDWVHRVKTF